MRPCDTHFGKGLRAESKGTKVVVIFIGRRVWGGVFSHHTACLPRCSFSLRSRSLSRATSTPRTVGIGVREVRTHAAKHPQHFEYTDGKRFRAVVSRFFLAEGENEIL